jgi:hypothetical protein
MNHLVARYFYNNILCCALQGTWPQVSTWKIESNIIHGFLDELGVLNESMGYAPPHVLLARDTQFGPNATIVVTNVEAQQAILDDISNYNQGSSSKKTLKKGKPGVIKPSKQLAFPTISDPIARCKTPKALSKIAQSRTTNVKICNAPCKKTEDTCSNAHSIF